MRIHAIHLLLAAFMTLQPAVALDPLPVSGRPVPQLDAVDGIMNAFMQDSRRNIDAGVVGISRGGKIVYLKAFGWLKIPFFNQGTHLPETALMRVASLSKLVTAAAIHEADSENLLGSGGLDRYAFNLIGNGGILDVTPHGGLGDPDFALITTRQLLGHAGGFRRSAEPFYELRRVLNELQVPYAPPLPYDVLRWKLGEPLDDTPGTRWNQNPDNVRIITSSGTGNPSLITTSTPHRFQTGETVEISGHSQAVANGTFPINVVTPTSFTIPVNMPVGGTGGSARNTSIDPYSNFGYHVLGSILGKVAPGGYLGYVGQRVLSADHWIPSTEWAAGKAFYIDRNSREPLYQPATTGATEPSIFDNTPDENGNYEQVPTPYGPFSPELGVANGGLIMSAQAMLNFANLYHCGYGSGSPDDFDHVGSRITAANPMRSDFHTGGFEGTNTIVWQHPDSGTASSNVVIYVAFARNKATPNTEADPSWDSEAHRQIKAITDALPANNWPTATCDGFWVKLNGTEPTEGYGGYHSEYETLAGALNRVTNGSKLRIKPGTTTWTGTIETKLLIDAPNGPVTIGAPN